MWGGVVAGVAGDVAAVYVPTYDGALGLCALAADDGRLLWNHSSYDDKGHPYYASANPVLSADQKTIAAYCATAEGKAAVDNVGRKQCL